MDADGGVSMRDGGGNDGDARTFQWIETPTGELALMSLATRRFLRVDAAKRTLRADSPGPLPEGSDGVRLKWTVEPH